MKKKSLLVLSVLPFALYLFYFFGNWQNILREDDYWFFNDFVSYFSESSLIERFRPMFTVRNSHRIVPTYIIGYLQLILLGKLNAKFFLLFGFLFFTGVVIILGKSISTIGKKYIVPVLFLVLNPISYWMTFFPFPSIQLYSTFFFMMLAIYSLVFIKKAGLHLVVIWAICCTFSNGNGMMVWPALGFILLIKRDFSRLKTLIIWGCIIVVLYFVNYSKNEFQHSQIPLKNFLINFAAFVVSFLGNGLDVFPHFLYSSFSEGNALVKILIVLRFLGIIGFSIYFMYKIPQKIFYIINKRNYSKDKPLLLFVIGVFVFIFCSDLTAAVFRSNEGVGIGISERYRFYGQIIIVLFYILYVLDNQSKNKYKFALIASIFYWAANYIVYSPFALNFKAASLASSINIVNNSNTYIYEVYGKDIDSTINKTLIPSITKYGIFDFYSDASKVEILKIKEKMKSDVKGVEDVKYLDNFQLEFQNLEISISSTRILAIESDLGNVIFAPVELKPLVNKNYHIGLPSYTVGLRPNLISNGTSKLYLVCLKGGNLEETRTIKQKLFKNEKGMLALVDN